MEKLRHQKNLLVAKYSFWISFVSGTMIFALYTITRSIDWVFMGGLFIQLAWITNCVILIALLVNAYEEKAHRKPLLKAALLLLLNIPICILYCFTWNLFLFN